MKAYAVLNNHPRAAAVANAAELKAMVGQGPAQPYPRQLVTAYPQVAEASRDTQVGTLLDEPKSASRTRNGGS
jgi:hypothetical protein